MLNNNNVDSVISIVQEASSKLSFGYLDSSFLLSDNNELSMMFLYSFKRSINEILQDIYKNNLYFNKKQSTLKSEYKNDYYYYSTLNIPIFRIYDVRNLSSKLYKVFSYNELDKNKSKSYLEEPFKLVSKTDFTNLSIEYLSTNIYFKDYESIDDVYSELKSQNDYCLIDKNLIISKMCSILAQQKGLPNVITYEQEYQQCLSYNISLGISGSKDIRF